MVAFERTHAAWILLSVETCSHLAARGLRHVDCFGLFFDSDCSGLLCAKKAGSSIWLDVRMFWRIYHCVRRDPRHGSLDSLGPFLLVVGRGQGHYCPSLGTDGNIPRPECTGGIEPPKSRGDEGDYRTVETAESHPEKKRRALPANGRQHPGDILDFGPQD